jgi:hydroxyethylthiazole kinase-like uncharacterized protein yjeF
MHIFNTSQIHAWDEYTIRHEPVSSIDLMERAAKACFEWLMLNNFKEKGFSIFCGKGNNGGDGLAIARMLANSGHKVNVYILEFGHKGTDDFQHNLALLHETTAEILFISTEDTIYPIQKSHIIIDALLGSGLNRVLEGLTAALVHHLNNSGHEIISIDVPTGLFADKSSLNNVMVRASHTLSFQCFKLAFLLQENQEFIGKLHVLDIGLHPGFIRESVTEFHLTDHQLVKSLVRSRGKFSHKGDYGNGAMFSGSTGFMGAAVLSSRAFMRSGAGKLTCHIPRSGYTIMQVAIPEAMSKIEEGGDHIQSVGSLEKYDAIGVGPGLGLHDSHYQLLTTLFENFRKPVVIDADALNILSKKQELMRQLPPLSILTPHVKEFERLFGSFTTDFDRIQTALKKANEFNILIVLKGAYTFIATPSGKGYFNSTGNPGMATAGSGDVLTGIITGLLCQGYASDHAAIAGVYLHGLSGDLAAAVNSQQALIASDIINYLGQAFKALET